MAVENGVWTMYGMDWDEGFYKGGVYMTPEELWGYDLVTSAYKEKPEASRERIYRPVREHYPNATEKQIKILMK